MVRYAVSALFSIFAMIYTALSLYACSAAPPPVNAPRSDIPITTHNDIVNILQSRPEISQSLQQAIELYTSANPGAHINVATVSGPSDYNVALRTRLLSGERADVFHIFSGQEARELKPFLEDLSDLAWLHGAAEQAIEPMSFDGGVYGLPYSIECYGFIANRDVFEASGIPLSGIGSFQDLEDAFAELRSKLADGSLEEDFPTLRNVTDLPIQDKNYLGRLAANTILTGEFDAPSQALSRKELKLPYGGGAEELFQLLKRYSAKDDWTERDGLSWSSQLEDFARGRTASLLCDRSGVEEILAINPSLEGRITLLPVPIPGLDESSVYTGAPLWWGISSSAADAAKASAKRFLTWLYQSESGTAVVAARFGAVSPWLEAGKETGKSFDRQMLSFMDRGRTAPQIWREFPYAWGAGAFTNDFRSWYAGEIKWDVMLQRMTESWAYG